MLARNLYRSSIFVICRTPFAHHGGCQEVRFRISLLVKHGFHVSLVHGDHIEVDQDIFEWGPHVRLIYLPGLFDTHPARYLSWRRNLVVRQDQRHLLAVLEEGQPAAIMVHGERPARIYLRVQKKYRLYFFRSDAMLSCCVNERLGPNRCQAGPSLRCLLNAPENSLSKVHLAGKMLLRSVDLWGLSKLDHFVANSRYVARIHRRPEALVQYPPIWSGNVDRESSRALPRRRNLHALVFAGRLESVKGPLDALSILAELPSSFRLFVIGDGPLRSIMEQQARAMSLAERVEFTGWIDSRDVRAIMSRAGCTVITSHWDEAFGMVKIESFAEGTPVVAYDVGGLSEFVRGPVGILVSWGDTSMAARAVEEICTDLEKWGERSRACRETFTQHFAPGRFESELLAMVS